MIASTVCKGIWVLVNGLLYGKAKKITYTYTYLVATYLLVQRCTEAQQRPLNRV